MTRPPTLLLLVLCKIVSCQGFIPPIHRPVAFVKSSFSRGYGRKLPLRLHPPRCKMTTDRVGDDKSLESLCAVSKRACDLMVPMIAAFYESMNSDTSKLKEDQSVFTIADGCVQHFLTEQLFGARRFRAIVGEEECAVDLSRRPYRVDDLMVPEQFSDLLEKTRKDVAELGDSLGTCDLYKQITAFIDPIDGTREFSTGKGEQCSVCIGFADTEGKPVAGLVYRPLTDPPTWVAGAKSEHYAASELDVTKDSSHSVTGLLTSNGSISPFLVSLMDKLGYVRVPSGGAGNKMLMLLEGKGAAYIQDRGVSRWDTCAAQACIEAHGGVLCKLTSFINDSGAGECISYTYLETEQNLDFEPGVANLTSYNCSPRSGFQKGDAKRPAQNVDEVKPYANLSGLFALCRSKNTAEGKKAIQDSIRGAMEQAAPAFD